MYKYRTEGVEGKLRREVEMEKVENGNSVQNRHT